MSRFDRHIVMIGMMGAGKTTIGRQLASRLGYGFWDNDEALSQATGETAAEVQRAEGQDALHRLENRLLREALADQSLKVFAAAASVVLEPELLAGAVTVWLRVSPTREAENIAHSGQDHRPLPGDPVDALRRVGAEREHLYAQLADVMVDVGSADPGATCEQVLAALRACASSQCAAGEQS